jgi:hypothetical protein
MVWEAMEGLACTASLTSTLIYLHQISWETKLHSIYCGQGTP